MRCPWAPWAHPRAPRRAAAPGQIDVLGRCHSPKCASRHQRLAEVASDGGTGKVGSGGHARPAWTARGRAAALLRSSFGQPEFGAWRDAGLPMGPSPPDATHGREQSVAVSIVNILGLIVCRDVDCVALRTSCLWRNDAARDEPAAPSGHRRVASGVQPRPARLSTGSTNKNGSSLISRQTRHRASRFPVRRTSTRAALLVLSSPDTGRAASALTPDTSRRCHWPKLGLKLGGCCSLQPSAARAGSNC